MIATQLGAVLAVTPAEPRTVACFFDYADSDFYPDWYRVTAWATVVDHAGDLHAVPIGYGEDGASGRAYPLTDTTPDEGCAIGTDRTDVLRRAHDAWQDTTTRRARRARHTAHRDQDTAGPFRLGQSTFGSPHPVTPNP